MKLLQFADDSNLVLENEESLYKCLSLVEAFSKISGLHLNRNKTQAVWLGCWKFRRKEVGGITWKIFPDNNLKILGAYIKPGCMMHENAMNWEGRFLKCESIIRSWNRRKLSIIGKVVLIKTFLLPQFQYIMQATILSDDILGRVNRLMFKFLWSKTGLYKENDLQRVVERVKRTILIQNYENHGLNMIDVKDMQKAFTFKRLASLSLGGNGSWRIIPNYYYSLLGKNLAAFKCNTTPRCFRGMNLNFPYYYRNLLLQWLECKVTFENATNIESPILWNNDEYKFKGNVLFNLRWIKAGITTVFDVIDLEGRPDYYKLLNFLPDTPITSFEFNSVNMAILRSQQKLTDHLRSLGEVICFIDKPISAVTTKEMRIYLQKQKLEIIQPDHENTMSYWTVIPNITREARLIELQWKILHKIYPSNSLLYKMKLTVSPQCDYCQVEDNLEHFFCLCEQIHHIWTKVELIIKKETGYKLILTNEIKLLGLLKIPGKKSRINDLNLKFINHVLIIAKMCISKFKHGNYTDIVSLLEMELSLREPQLKLEGLT